MDKEPSWHILDFVTSEYIAFSSDRIDDSSLRLLLWAMPPLLEAKSITVNSITPEREPKCLLTAADPQKLMLVWLQ